jgi:hypothetical protein
MLTRKRRCLRVTTMNVLLYECLGGRQVLSRPLESIERKRHHRPDYQRRSITMLQPPTPRLYTGNSTIQRPYWRLFIDMHTGKLTRIAAYALTNSLPG